MRASLRLAVWALAGLAAAAVAVWAFPRAYPLFPAPWTTSKADAEALALARVAELGPMPEGAFVDSRLRLDHRLEARVLRALTAGTPGVAGSQPAREIALWEVSVYAPQARTSEWTYRALVTLDGEATGVIHKLPPDEAVPGVLEPAEAAERAGAYLISQGYDLAGFAEPEVRTENAAERVDLVVRFRDRAALLGPDRPYGMQVMFAGDRLTGYDSFYDGPRQAGEDAGIQGIVLLNQLWVFLPILLAPIVAIFFLRRYHHGEIGVRRGLQIFAVVLALGLVTLAFCAVSVSADFNLGILTRVQTIGVVTLQMIVLFFFPTAVLALLSWSVGESLCRERWGAKLAAFDALFQLDWTNATFARASLQGLVGALAIVAFQWGAAAAIGSAGAPASLLSLLSGWWPSAGWFAVPLVAMGVAYGLYAELFTRLLLVSAFVQRLGRVAGIALATLLGAMLVMPGIFFDSMAVNLPMWIAVSGFLVFLFLRCGLFTAVLASIGSGVIGAAGPMLAVDDSSLQVQAALALLAVAVPFLVSVRHLGSDREFVYRWEDVPPHVRRIAERERLRVEMETARRIQSSILPDLPPSLAGVEIAHAYLPATEVGGDFYDVLALEDGRLAVAVGDVAGHGVSSGLVMSMARSALAVQVTFDPEVGPVFNTLNRMVYQTARKRLLATLCYALLDPKRRELLYASAGHLFPYRIDAAGRVEALESIAYPLGVRNPMAVEPRLARLAAGDTLFLYSDGIVESRREGGDDLFGFPRLEATLKRLAGSSPGQIRDGVLAEVERFTGAAPREDDQTLLVLRVP